MIFDGALDPSVLGKKDELTPKAKPEPQTVVSILFSNISI